jgi:hypothetical protein
VSGEGREAYCTSGIRHKVEERPDKWDDASICCDSISNRTHAVLTDTVANVSALVTSQACVLRLEVNRALDLSEITARQVRGTTEEIRKCRSDCGENNLR